MRRIFLPLVPVAALVVAIGIPAPALSWSALPGPSLPGPSAPAPAPQPAMDDAGHRPSLAVAGAESGQPGSTSGQPESSLGGGLANPDADLPADWSKLGPDGGDAFAVAVSPVDPDLMLAGTAPRGGPGGNLYRSTDRAATWTQVPSLAGTSVVDLDFTPAGDAFAATVDGIWTSTDAGATWTQLALGIGPSQSAAALTVDPSNPDVLWAGIGDALGSQPINLIRSTNGGATWTDQTPPLPAPIGGSGIAVDPTDPDTVIATFAGAFGGGAVWVTTNGGLTWANRSAGLPGNPIDDVQYDGSRLLVGGGQLFGSQHVGLYSSDNLGSSWTPLHDASWPIPAIDAIAVDPNDPATILVASDANGVHRTTDGGDTWQTGIGGSQSLAGRSLAYAPGSSSELLLGTSSLAVYHSTDGGDTFTQSSEGINEIDLTSIAANPQNPAELAISFVGQNDGGVLSSRNLGASWDLEQVPPTRYNAVEFAPDGTLFAVSDGPSSIAPEGLYRRDADGWVSLGPDQGNLFESRLGLVRFSQTDPDLIMMAGSDFGVAGNEATIWRSADAGESWTKVYEQGANASVTDLNLVADGTDQRMQAVWFTFTNGPVGGALRSTDGGQSWVDANTGLPGGFFRDSRLCGSPSDPDTAYLSYWTSFSTGTIFRSTDAGQSWQPTGYNGARIVDLACDPVDDQVLYLSQSGTTPVVLRSADQAASFQPYATGLETVTVPRNLAFTQGGTEMVLASRQGGYLTALREQVGEPAIEVTPGSIRATQAPGEVTEHPLTIGNTGDALLTWLIAESDGDVCDAPTDVPWLAAEPADGSTPAGGGSPVTVTVNSTDLAAGEHSAALCVLSNDPAQPIVTVPVTVTVQSAGGGACDQTITGVHDGPLTVTDGTTCLAAGAQVRGEVNVTAGAGLIGTAAVIQGPVSAVGATVLELRYSQVTGPVLVLGATDSVALFGTQVTGSVSLLNSSTAATVSGNTVIGTLSCFGNQPPPTDHGLPNTATGGKLGQCADL